MISWGKIDKIAKDIDSYADELSKRGNLYSMDQVIDFLRGTFNLLDKTCEELSDLNDEIQYELKELQCLVSDLREERDRLQDDLYAAECDKGYAEEELEALRLRIEEGD